MEEWEVHVIVHGTQELLKRCSELLSKLSEGETESRVKIHHRVFAVLFVGVLQLLMDAVEEARRDQEQLPKFPEFAALMSYLCKGASKLHVHTCMHVHCRKVIGRLSLHCVFST